MWFLKLQMPDDEKDDRELTKINTWAILKILVLATWNEIKYVSAEVMVQTNSDPVIQESELLLLLSE